MSEDAELVQLSVLGSLEVRFGDEPVRLGGPKQRAVLATLLLRANEIVSVAQLLDAVWGEHAPPTGRHTLEVYVSRLRAKLSGTGAVRLLARAPGYVLLVEPEFVDSLRFGDLAERGRAARATGDPSGASELFRTALSLWRGRVAQDVELASDAHTAAELLEDLRLAVLEEWIELELDAGNHSVLVRELEALVAMHPFRDRFRAALMLALHRSGRRVEALDVYHAGRRTLAAELGLEPSGELRRLAGHIIREDPALDVGNGGEPSAPGRVRESRRGRIYALYAVPVAVTALALASVVAFGPGDDPPTVASPLRVALFMPGGLGDADGFPLGPTAWRGLQQAVRDHDARAELVGAEGQPDEWERQLELTVGRGYDLVIAGLSASGPVLSRVARRHPEQQFAFLDGSSAEAGDLPNVAGIAFAENEAGFLAGFLAGAIERTSSSRLNTRRTVSTVGALPVPAITRYLGGFKAGVHHASPDVDIVEGFTNNFVGQHLCGQLANRQIDLGSDIVFAVAGTCGFGAMAAAEIRGVWTIGVDGDLSYLGPHVLASAIKRLDRAVLLAVEWFVQGRLTGGTDIVLDLEANAVGLVGISAAVPASIRRNLAEVDARIRAGEIVVPTR